MKQKKNGSKPEEEITMSEFEAESQLDRQLEDQDHE